VLPPGIKARLAVEAGVSQGWHRWVGSDGAIVSMDHFGASAPANTLFKEFGFTVEHVVDVASELVADREAVA
jgi:transketolase